MNRHTIPQNNFFSVEFIQRWVDDILGKYGEMVESFAPPICEKILTKAIEEIKGIKIVLEAEKKISTFDEGLLMPIRGGFMIKYGTFSKKREKFHRVKIRETICHELAHILFYDCTSLMPRLGIRPPEYLCHDIARKLLLPTQLLKENFSEKKKESNNLIDLIEQLSRDFQVALKLMAKRLTEDLPILNSAMVTFWRYKAGNEGPSNKQVCYGDYERDPKFSRDLSRLLPKYWRDRVHSEAWDKVVSKVAIGETDNLPASLYVKGKKRKNGRIKSIPFDIQCSSLYNKSFNRSYNINFGWYGNIKPAFNILSVKQFDLNILEKGK